jgi:hypothetical protein
LTRNEAGEQSCRFERGAERPAGGLFATTIMAERGN